VRLRESVALEVPLEAVASHVLADRCAVVVGLPEVTAEHHVSAVLSKLGVTTRRDAARRAVELGLMGTEQPCQVR
jgi:hypothetical protein